MKGEGKMTGEMKIVIVKTQKARINETAKDLLKLVRMEIKLIMSTKTKRNA